MYNLILEIMKGLMLFFLFSLVLFFSCTKELLHKPGIPYLEIKVIDEKPNEYLKEVKVSFFTETPNIEVLRFTLKAYEDTLIIPSDEIIFKAIVSTQDVFDVVSEFELTIENFDTLTCSGISFPPGFQIDLPPVPYKIEIQKDSTVEFAISMTSKVIGNYYNNRKTSYYDGTRLRVSLSDSLKIKVYNTIGTQVTGVYGSAWGKWIEFRR